MVVIQKAIEAHYQKNLYGVYKFGTDLAESFSKFQLQIRKFHLDCKICTIYIIAGK